MQPLELSHSPSFSLSDSISHCLTLWHSLSTSSVLKGLHPLTQDSLSFSSSIISCNVLNLESPNKSSASLYLCLFLRFSTFFVLQRLQIVFALKWPGPTIHLMEMASPVPGSDLTALSIETVLWKKDVLNKIPRCSENLKKWSRCSSSDLNTSMILLSRFLYLNVSAWINISHDTAIHINF